MVSIVIADKVPGIYMIRNNVTQKLYIGQSHNVFDRLHWHRLVLNKGTHHCSALQNTWNKHGEDNFSLEQIESCDLSILTEREQYWIDSFNTLVPNGYNLRPADAKRGYKLSEDHKRKIRDGRAAYMNDPETRRQLSERAKAQHAAGNFGQKTWTRKPKYTKPAPRPRWTYWPKRFRQPWMIWPEK